jgi:AcrR family transcriptional regulator
MSTPPPSRSAKARQPLRRRGHLRVAAILEAATEIFAERGYDAATMTEIAARSGTATGSLYRFFPSKESLADALLQRYAQQALDGLSGLVGRAASLPLDDLAGELVEFKLGLEPGRGFALALVDARGGSEAIRSQFRAAMLGALENVLRRAVPGLARERSETMAVLVLHVLKAVSGATRESAATRELLLDEVRTLMKAYLAAARPPGGL